MARYVGPVFLSFLQAWAIVKGMGQLLVTLTVYRHLPFFGVDFKGAFLLFAAMLADGSYASLYDVAANQAWQEAHGGPGLFYQFVNPPLLGVALAPYVSVPVPEAVDQWFFFNLRLAVALGFLLGLWAGPNLPMRARILLGIVSASAFLTSAPVLACLIYGQIGLVLTALSAGFCWASVKNRKALAAGLLSLAISLKVYPAALLLPALARRDWRTLGFTVLGCLLWGVCLWFYVGNAVWEITGSFFRIVLPQLQATGGIVTDQSLLGVCSRLMGPAGATIGQLLGLLLIGTAVWNCRKVLGEKQVALSLALACYVQCLCVGRSWAHYHPVLWLALALLSYSQPRLSTRPVGLAVALMLPIAMYECDVASQAMEWRMWSASVGFYSLLMLLLYGLCLGELRRQQRQDP